MNQIINCFVFFRGPPLLLVPTLAVFLPSILTTTNPLSFIIWRSTNKTQKRNKSEVFHWTQIVFPRRNSLWRPHQHQGKGCSNWCHQMPPDEVSKMIHPSNANVFQQMNNSQCLSAEPDTKVTSSHDRFYPTSKWSYQEQFQFIRNSLKLIETFGFRPTELCSFKTQLSFTVDRRDAAGVVALPRTLSTHHFWERIKEEDIVKSHNQKIIFKFFSLLELNFSCIQTAKPTDYSKNSLFFTSSFKSLQNWSLFKLISKPFTCEWWNQSKSWKCQFLSSLNCNKRIKKIWLAQLWQIFVLWQLQKHVVRKPYYLI